MITCTLNPSCWCQHHGPCDGYKEEVTDSLRMNVMKDSFMRNVTTIMSSISYLTKGYSLPSSPGWRMN